MSMAVYVCPICDHKMKSRHFCANCRSYIKEPFTREVTYYLNERHPSDEADCTYHQREERQGVLTGGYGNPAPNRPSLAGRASLNGAGQTASVPNQPTNYDQTGASVPRQAPTPNQPRKNTFVQPFNRPVQPLNMENMEQYLKAMKEIGKTGIQGAAELLKEKEASSRGSRQRFEARQEQQKQEQKKISTLAMVIIFIVFVNIFTSVIVPFFRHLMSSIF